MASSAGEMGGAAVSPAYAASKAAKLRITKSTARYLAAYGDQNMKGDKLFQ